MENTVPDNCSFPLLHLACQNKHLANAADIVKLLIDNSGNIAAKDDDYMTTLHYACQYGNYNIVKLLIDNKADVNARGFYADKEAKDDDEYTLLMLLHYKYRKEMADYEPKKFVKAAKHHRNYPIINKIDNFFLKYIY